MTGSKHVAGSPPVAAADFEARYRRDPDPWRFATSPYEQRRYDLTLAALPRSRYRRAFEPGCSIGVLTERLAERCDRLVAIDGAPSALARARRRCAGLAHVELRGGMVPDDWPEGSFDLIVLSELGYYFGRPALGQLVARAVSALDAGGHLVGVHWRGSSADHVLGGDEVHEVLAAAPLLARCSSHVEADFRLDVWTRR